MTDELVAMLPEYVLGSLDDAQRKQLQSALAESAELRDELDAVRETLASLGSQGTDQATAAGRQALLGALDNGERYKPFFDSLCLYLDLPRERVRELCMTLDDPASWTEGPLPGIQLIHFDAGPGAYGPDTGFVRQAAGLKFPYHRHQGPEVNIVLEGAFRDDDGTLYMAGDAPTMPANSEHSYEVMEQGDLIVVVAHVGFDLVERPE